MSTRYLACDLGAESGRLMAGTLEAGRLSLDELHRWQNTPKQSGASLHWNIGGLFSELEEGLRKVAASGWKPDSISTDSWGVDYLLYNAAGQIIEPTFHYRDPRCAEGVKRAFALAPWEEVFANSGIQFMQLNTIYQLAAEDPSRLADARLLLGIGDGFNHWLSGVARFEESLASTTQLYDPRTRDWSKALLGKLGLNAELFGKIVPSGTKLGVLREELQRSTGLGPISVIASCSHDTGAAVAAVPAEGNDWAYLSSGTWSLMGIESPRPVLTPVCRDLNFTNEIGYGGTVRLLKNISGLWLVQECKREWAREGHDYDYAALTQMASEARPFASLVNPADPVFLSPGGMPARIAEVCRGTGQPVPETPGAFVRCALESLALLYRRTLRHLEQLSGSPIRRLHIVGGGSKNALLNQFAADSLQIPVMTGPVEATAAGNVLVQAIAMGHLDSLAAARRVVRDSFEVATVQPGDSQPWEAAWARFNQLFPPS